jgi:hypothetical protein
MRHGRNRDKEYAYATALTPCGIKVNCADYMIVRKFRHGTIHINCLEKLQLALRLGFLSTYRSVF